MTAPAPPPTTPAGPPPPPGPSPSWLRTRTRIVIAFWSIIAIGIPFWWKTTTIQRLPLPTSSIQSWSRQGPCYLRPPIDLHLTQDGGTNVLTSHVASALRREVANEALAKCLNVHVREGPRPQGHNKAYELVLGDGDQALRAAPRTVAVATAEGDEALIVRNAVDAARSVLGLDLAADDARVVKFSPRYKLVISLLNQNAAAGEALLGWDIDQLLERHLAPLLTSLAPLHTFEIQTQIQYFAPLTVELHTVEGEEGKIVSEDDLKAFINPAGWNLGSSVTLDPTLNLMLFVPSPENRPLRIQSDRPSAANAFITPQRGGVVIFNPEQANWADAPDLSPAFRLFEQQLRLLLGVPPAPPGAPTSGALAAWQVDALVRRRLAEATKQSLHHLNAIVKLVEDIPNMPVGVEVQRGINKALEELELAREALATSSARALQHASCAMEEASKAYFNPTMLALLYFPDEHKYTVYAPFFGPVAVPLLAALAKEVKAWKEKRRKAKAVAAGGEVREKQE